MYPARHGRDDLGHRQIRHENVIPALDHFIEFVAARFGKVQLEQGAGVAVKPTG
jgi:hypothetical protein